VVTHKQKNKKKLSDDAENNIVTAVATADRKKVQTDLPIISREGYRLHLAKSHRK